MKIHPTAIVEDGARLGVDVEIGPYCAVSAHAVLDDGVRLVSHVVIAGEVEIGARTVVHPQAVLGGESQIRNNDARDTRLVIGVDNVIREFVTMSLGSRRGGGVTSVGDRGYFMAASHVGHDCHVGDDVTLSNGALLAGHVEVGDGVIMGGASAVQQFGRIGRNAFVGGLSGANTDVIPYAIATGPHIKLDGLNLVGLKRRGLPRATIHKMRAAYRTIFLEADGKLDERARRAADTWPDIAEIQEIVAFILAKAKRPICPARRRMQEDDDA
ncbi:MAG TPA: acyl-ACP--UDP-N-acetylglucosamine O-acyltransferase [Rhizomicrobium sp.]|nr:acyl-ACP--UDP-N-acetylglucosamine O-acyltransferase [Rhizomicrobium sp.]